MASNNVALVYGSPQGPRAGPTFATMRMPNAIAMADLDGDGRADVIVVSEEADEVLVIRGRRR
jgi:hypothetical protein